MNKKVLIVTIVFLVFLFQSCYVGMSYERDFTSLKGVEENKDCDKNIKEVDMFFECEKIDFEYEKIGLLEIKSNEHQKQDKDLLEELRMLAINNCCDAIINIRSQYLTRESGILFSQEELKKYDAKVYSGIGVKKKG